MRLRSVSAPRRVVAVVLVLLVAGVGAFVLAYFEPQKLFIDDRVNEALPMPRASAPAGSTMRSRVEIETLSSGGFRSYEHATSGQARVLRLADGSRFLRFERFRTSNGPDLRVYLSAAPSGGRADAFDDDYIQLGHLKGNIGPQNYRIPPEVDLQRLRTAVIWCRRFSVAFGAAGLR